MSEERRVITISVESIFVVLGGLAALAVGGFVCFCFAYGNLSMLLGLNLLGEQEIRFQVAAGLIDAVLAVIFIIWVSDKKITIPLPRKKIKLPKARTIPEGRET